MVCTHMHGWMSIFLCFMWNRLRSSKGLICDLRYECFRRCNQYRHLRSLFSPGLSFYSFCRGAARRELGVHFNELVTDSLRIGGYARYMEADGDGLDITPKGEPNLIASNPKRSVNGGVSLQWKNIDLRYDFVDFRHTYYVNPQYDIWQVLLESSDEFSFCIVMTFCLCNTHMSLMP